MAEVFIARTDKYENEADFRSALLNLPKSRIDEIEKMKDRAGKRLLLTAGVALSAALKSRGIDPVCADIKKTAEGKPYLASEKGVCFSISHSGNIGVCSVSGAENGVDVEMLGRAKPEIASRFFTNDENRFLKASDDYDLAFTRLWTLKESFSKYAGKGLSVISKTEFDMRSVPKLIRSPITCDPVFYEFAYGKYRISLCLDREENVTLAEI